MRVIVRYQPVSIGSHSVSVNLTSGNGGSLPGPVTFTGAGLFNPTLAWSTSASSLVAPTSAWTSFGTRTINSDQDLTFYLRNVGTHGNAQVGLSLTGDTAHFQLVLFRLRNFSSTSVCRSGGGIATGGLSSSAPCAADDVFGGSTPHYEIAVRYRPTAIGNHSVNLNVIDANGTVVPTALNITGNGT